MKKSRCAYINVKKLFILFTGYTQSDCRFMSYLTANLTNLEEIGMHCSKLMSIEYFTRIIEKHSKLRKIEIKLEYSQQKHEIDAFHDQFDNEWNITQTMNSGVMFVKKNSTILE